MYPDVVDAIVPFCASARTSPHNFVFLEGVKAALQADGNWAQGNYAQSPVRGLRAFSRVYAGWAYSQTFFRDGLYRAMGFRSVEELLRDWEDDHVRNWDANDLLAMLWSWQNSDIGANPAYSGDIAVALSAISARTVVIPCDQDLYFPPEDNELEVAQMPNAELRVYSSALGHCVASPGNDAGFHRFLDAAIRDVLSH